VPWCFYPHFSNFVILPLIIHKSLWFCSWSLRICPCFDHWLEAKSHWLVNCRGQNHKVEKIREKSQLHFKIRVGTQMPLSFTSLRTKSIALEFSWPTRKAGEWTWIFTDYCVACLVKQVLAFYSHVEGNAKYLLNRPKFCAKFTLTRAPNTPRVVSRRYSKDLVSLVVFKSGYKNSGKLTAKTKGSNVKEWIASGNISRKQSSIIKVKNPKFFKILLE
jgi:hypothetical protein